MTRITTDLDQAVYDRARRASREDRVLHVAFVRPQALNARERATAERIERESADAVRQVRRDRARMVAGLRRLEDPR